MSKTTEPAALAGIEQQFAEWMRQEMPAGTVIGDPDWWVPRILKAATVEQLVRERDGWIDSAKHFSNGLEYYRGQLDACARHIGLPCFTADDGGVHEEPLRAKVAEEVGRLVQARDYIKGRSVSWERDTVILSNKLAAMTKKADGFFDALQLAAKINAEGQAREQQLREALSTCQCYSNKQIAAALSLPQDDTALKAWGEKLLREIADGCRDGIDRAWITSKADELMEEKGNG